MMAFLDGDVRSVKAGEGQQTIEKIQLVAEQTAVIICDMWDRHWCRGASARVNEMAPEMDKVVRALRDRGCLIAHAPSGTMPFYRQHPARIRTLQLAEDQKLTVSSAGLKQLAAEPSIPVDPNRIECDCGQIKCRQHEPWQRQINAIHIADQDLIGEGSELLKAFIRLSVRDVLVMGVHTNICVVGRDFGIRSLIRHGFRPLLVRDLTDCMAPHDEFPFVSHFDALDYVIYHIETYLCGTVESAALIGNESSFRFSEDRRLKHAEYPAFLAAAEKFGTA